MLKGLKRLFGMDADAAGSGGDYDPVYGLPRRAVEEWLARNPTLRQQHEVEEWIARNPPLRQKYQAAQQQGSR